MLAWGLSDQLLHIIVSKNNNLLSYIAHIELIYMNICTHTHYKREFLLMQKYVIAMVGPMMNVRCLTSSRTSWFIPRDLESSSQSMLAPSVSFVVHLSVTRTCSKLTTASRTKRCSFILTILYCINIHLLQRQTD